MDGDFAMNKGFLNVNLRLCHSIQFNKGFGSCLKTSLEQSKPLTRLYVKAEKITLSEMLVVLV